MKTHTFRTIKDCYHGIILDLAFENNQFPEAFKLFAKRKSSENEWMVYGIEVKNEALQEVISNIQKNMKSSQPYYAHFYNDKELVVIFKEKVFTVKPHASTWNKIVEYGRRLHIPEEQLDFWPNRFQDENHYFQQEDFLI